jgi:tetratricopeptide (TPR) repeat protein
MGEASIMKRAIIALSLVVVGCQAANVEDNIVRLAEEGKVPQAQEEAKKSGATGKELVRLKGILFHAIGMPDSALVYLKQANKDNPSDARISLRLAEVLFWKKDFKSVRQIVESVGDKAVSEGPRRWESMMRKARLEAWLEQLDASRAMYDKVLQGPDTPEAIKIQARIRLAEIASWQKDFSKAIAILDSLLTAMPGHVDATLLKGQILEWKGEYPEAKTLYTAGLQIHPTDANLRYRLEKLSWVK